MTICKNCGAELEDKDCFCPKCGEPVAVEVAVEEPTQVFNRRPENVDVKMTEDRQEEPFIPNWDQAFACVPVDGDIPPREYFCAWDWIPEGERSPQLTKLADAYPLKKNRRWTNRIVLWVLVLFFCAAVFAGTGWAFWQGSQVIQDTIDSIMERIPDSYTIELPPVFDDNGRDGEENS